MASTDTYTMQRDAIGSVEVFGLVAAVEVADVMLKTANIIVKSFCNADAGIISVICEGDLAACKAAVDAGKAEATRMGGLLGSTLIGRPFTDTATLISDHAGSIFMVAKAQAAKPTMARASKLAKGRKK